MNTNDGRLLTLTTFGESHGSALGGILDGFPAGVAIDIDAVAKFAARRRPGQSTLTTARKEADSVKFLSGLLDNVTTGAPIGFMIENTNQRSADYSEIQNVYRPSHADFTYDVRYHGYADIRGGGRSSARETASRVVAGALAVQFLEKIDIRVTAFTRSIGKIKSGLDWTEMDFSLIESNSVRCPDPAVAGKMEDLILSVKSEGDTIGGVVECVVNGLPPGLGSPVFDKLSSRLASAMISINAAKAFEIGAGFGGTEHRGSEMNDTWVHDNLNPKRFRAAANNSGGIQGGISNGEPVVFRVGFKPVATLLKEIPTVDRQGNDIMLKARGRHDPCVVPRAIPIVESMAALVIMDEYLVARAYGVI